MNEMSKQTTHPFGGESVMSPVHFNSGQVSVTLHQQGAHRSRGNFFLNAVNGRLQEESATSRAQVTQNDDTDGTHNYFSLDLGYGSSLAPEKSEEKQELNVVS